jgi:hypothetical protein
MQQVELLKYIELDSVDFKYRWIEVATKSAIGD